ncbi:MAG: hypothetical protein WBA97_15565 [Actinophytocola sp.]|uniref:hypothetical protein n=1 Tax=Actinophytocola sp. TaxID=1872138 RepID=UPI003C708E07
MQAPDGYETDTGQMSSVGRTIGTTAEDAKGEVEEVQPAKVQAAEFGQHEDHQTYHADYAAAIEQFGAGSAAMCDNLVAFAGQLDAAGATYSESESGAQGNVNSVQV